MKRKRKPSVSCFSPVHLIYGELEADLRRKGIEPPEGLLELVIFASCPRMLEAPNILEAVQRCSVKRPELLYEVLSFVWEWYSRENEQVERGNKLAKAKRFLRDNLAVVQRRNGDIVPFDDNWEAREGDKVVRCDTVTVKDDALAEMLKLGKAGGESIRNARRTLAGALAKVKPRPYKPSAEQTRAFEAMAAKVRAEVKIQSHKELEAELVKRKKR